MALFSFSQKNKNPADPAQPEAKSPAAPPKLQPPPPPGAATPPPAITPPPMPPPMPPPGAAPGAPPTPRGVVQTGSVPTLGKAVSAATRGVTQPIVMPKRGPGSTVRSTQRIVVPGSPQPVESTPQFHTSSIQLPVLMILRSIQLPALAGPISDLERSPAGSQKISIPLSMILPQLPSGKIEIPMQELVNLIPAELLAPSDRLAPYLGSMVHLPLMEVVMLIPPDMLALRPDQKQVDTSVTNMADPFTEESIRQQAEQNRREKAAADNAGSEFSPAERNPSPLAAGMTSTAPMPRTSRPSTPPPQAPPSQSTPPPAAPPRMTPPPAPAPAPQVPANPPVPPASRLPSSNTMSRPGTISLPMVNRPTAKTTTPAPQTPPPTPAPAPASFAPPPSRQIPPVQRSVPPPPPPPEPEPEPEPEPVQEPEPEPETTYQQPEPEPEPVQEEAPAPQPAPPAPAPAPAAPEPKKKPAGPLNLNSCTADDLSQIPGINREIAESIVSYRKKIGAFRKLQDLLDVPMMTRGIYGLLTGEEAQPTTLNDLLGFPTEQNLTLKDIMERISCWPDVTGCVLGQSNGLPIVGSLSPKVKLDKAAIVAFAPRMFEALNKSFAEMSGSQTDELIIPTSDTSFHILRKGDLYLIILAKAQQMPSRHLQVARLVLASLNFK